MPLFRSNQSSRLTVYFRDDIHDALNSASMTVNEIVREAPLSDSELQAYQRGFNAALKSVGYFFGIDFDFDRLNTKY